MNKLILISVWAVLFLLVLSCSEGFAKTAGHKKHKYKVVRITFKSGPGTPKPLDPREKEALENMARRVADSQILRGPAQTIDLD